MKLALLITLLCAGPVSADVVWHQVCINGRCAWIQVQVFDKKPAPKVQTPEPPKVALPMPKGGGPTVVKVSHHVSSHGGLVTRVAHAVKHVGSKLVCRAACAVSKVKHRLQVVRAKAAQAAYKTRVRVRVRLCR